MFISKGSGGFSRLNRDYVYRSGRGRKHPNRQKGLEASAA